MPSRRSTALQWVSIFGAVVCIIAFAIWLVLQFSQGDLDRGDKLASVVSMSVTIVTLPLSVLAIVVTFRQGRGVTRIINPSEHLDAMAESLAISVRAQWEAEEQVRRIHDPFPLPARWTNAPEHLMDHWQNINRTPKRSERMIMDDHGDHIVDTFNRIPSGRLVILGRAGAGKTILTSRFLLTLLADRTSLAGMSVPVIFSLGSWDPTASSLRDWQTEQLTTTYPILGMRDDTGTTVAALLLATGRIMPVLDGFDEITAGLRVDAIIEINAGLRPDDRLLLTSRPEEYTAAVQAGNPLTAAAVVSLEGLTVDDLASYLPLTTRKTGADRTTNKWDPVLDQMRRSPDDSALTDVLSTPLMVALARAIFSDTDADPAEMLHGTSAASLEARLLAGFVPAVYSRVRHDGTRVSAEDASRWLGFLAKYLHRLDTYDLAWWQLGFAVPRFVAGLVSGFLIALMGCLSLGLVGFFGIWASDDGRTAWLAAGLVASIAGGMAGGIVIGMGWGIPSAPSRLRMRTAGMLGRIRYDLAVRLRSWPTMIWFLLCSGSGTAFGLAASLLLDSEGGAVIGLTAGLFIGFGILFVVISVRALGAPVDPTEIVSPAELLRTDRGTALRQGLMVGVGAASVSWLTIWLGLKPLFGLVFSGVWLLGWLIAVGCGALIWVLFMTVWGPWLIARTWLPLTDRLPWSVMAFMADAHRRGVLRQAGGVYQFRHARLQEHLAAAHSDAANSLPACPIS